MGGSSILLAAYGARDPMALATYERTVDLYQLAFPGRDITLSFTSRRLRGAIEVGGRRIIGPEDALSKLSDDGFEHITVQSLQVVPGSEFHQLAYLVRSAVNRPGLFGFESLRLGLPLLAGVDDCMNVSRAISSQLCSLTEGSRDLHVPRDPRDEAVVFMGHGTAHPASSAYCQAAMSIENEHENVFLGTMDSTPTLDDVIRKARASGVSSVRLMPFLLVTGTHAANDLAGSGRSWRRAFDEAGFRTSVFLRGLLDNRDVAEVMLEHTRKAF
jgi:sirohydrochlorin cobaltochelatase